MKTFECPTCEREKPLSSLHQSGDCWNCHVKGVGVTFVAAGGYGRSNWNNGTYGETISQIHADAKAAGNEIQSMTRWV